jgi:hypothetical protein
VQTNPRIFIIFWGPTWNDEPPSNGVGNGSGDPYHARRYLKQFTGHTMGQPWLNTLAQYAVGSPTGSITVFHSVDTQTSPPNGLEISDVQNEVLRALSVLGNTPSVNDNYLIMTPHNVVPDGFGSTFCAYHSYATDAKGRKQPFTLMPYVADAGYECTDGGTYASGTNLEPFSPILGHEIAETMSDPLLNAWLDANGNEVADKCANTSNTTYNPDAGAVPAALGLGASFTSFVTQPLWSNSLNLCNQGPTLGTSAESPYTLVPPSNTMWESPTSLTIPNATSNVSTTLFTVFDNPVASGGIVADLSSCPASVAAFYTGSSFTETLTFVPYSSPYQFVTQLYIYGLSPPGSTTPVSCTMTLDDGTNPIVAVPVTATM